MKWNQIHCESPNKMKTNQKTNKSSKLFSVCVRNDSKTCVTRTTYRHSHTPERRRSQPALFRVHRRTLNIFFLFFNYMYLDLHWTECERNEVNYFVKPIFVVAVVGSCCCCYSFFFVHFRIEETNYHASLIFYCAAYVHCQHGSWAKNSQRYIASAHTHTHTRYLYVDDDTLQRVLHMRHKCITARCASLLFTRQSHSLMSNICSSTEPPILWTKK